MKILETVSLPLAGTHLIRFARFCDQRGYFTETFRRSDFDGLDFLEGIQFVQSNESFSKRGVIRGLHFQWNPYMGKLVRTIQGRAIDLILDIRSGSPTFGKAIAVDLPATPDADANEWVWIPPGFAHGNLFTEPTTIEYFCSGQYSHGCEAGISPLAADIDWSLCDPKLKATFDEFSSTTAILTDKDRIGFTLGSWSQEEAAKNFVYGQC